MNRPGFELTSFAQGGFRMGNQVRFMACNLVPG